MIIGFTGSRQEPNFNQKVNIINQLDFYLPKIEKVIHGGCIGSDSFFHKECLKRNLFIEVYPGYSKKNPKDLTFRGDYSNANLIYNELPFLERNRLIVNNSDLILSTPNTTNTNDIKYFTENLKGGTWYTIKYAIRKKKKIKIYCPNFNKFID